MMSKLGDRLVLVPHRAGATLARAGQYANSIIVIKEGAVHLITRDAKRKAANVAELGSTNSYGEVSALAATPTRNAFDAVAATDCVLYRIDLHDLLCGALPIMREADQKAAVAEIDIRAGFLTRQAARVVDKASLPRHLHMVNDHELGNLDVKRPWVAGIRLHELNQQFQGHGTAWWGDMPSSRIKAVQLPSRPPCDLAQAPIVKRTQIEIRAERENRFVSLRQKQGMGMVLGTPSRYSDVPYDPSMAPQNQFKAIRPASVLTDEANNTDGRDMRQLIRWLGSQLGAPRPASASHCQLRTDHYIGNAKPQLRHVGQSKKKKNKEKQSRRPQSAYRPAVAGYRIRPPAR